MAQLNTDRFDGTLAQAAKNPLRTALTALLVIGLVAVPFVLPSQIALIIEILLLALLAMSLDVLAGYTGLVSFGHAAFYGVGAYATAISFIYLTESAWVAMAIGVLAAALIAVPVGYLSIRNQGIYFAMITLAFAQLIYITIQNDLLGITGGSNGLSGLPVGNYGVPGVFGFQLTTIGQYFLVVTTFVGSFLILRRILRSPFGATLVAIRENETRATYAGYDIQRYKFKAFVISAVFGGVAGALHTPFYQAISPELLFWTLSGSLVAMVILGGIGTLIGPVLGAGLFIVMRELVSPYLADWRIVLGVAFIVTIIFVPGGLYELMERAQAAFDSQE